MEFLMTANINKRIEYIDIDKSLRVLDQCERHISDLLEKMKKEPQKYPQRCYQSLAGQYERSAMVSYALGYQFANILDLLKKSIDCYEHVIRLRGSEPSFPESIVNYNPALPPKNKISTVVELANPLGSKDYSLGNSSRCYHVACLSLIVGLPVTAKRVAMSAWDPPDASYIGNGRHAACTKADQQLAFAFRKFYELDELDNQGAYEIISQINASKSETHDITNQVKIWKGVLLKNPSIFLEGLDGLLEWRRIQI